MAELLKEFQATYVPRKGEQILKPIIMHGDVATEERGRHVQWTYRTFETPYKQLKGIDLNFAEFYMKMYLYEVQILVIIKS